MYNFLTKNGQLLAFGLGLLITIIFLISVLGGMDGFNALGEDDKGTTGIFNAGLWAAIILVILGAIAIVLFGVYHAIQDPKGAMKFLIGIAGLVVVFFIFYAMAKPVTEEDGKIFSILQKFNISESVHKFISGALATTVSLALLAAAAFLLSEARNLFK